MTACFDRNDLEVPQKFRKVYEFGGGDWQTDDDGGVRLARRSRTTPR